MAEMISGLEAIAGRYEAILCDVWGVVHDGIHPFPHACAALARARSQGLPVILVTNAPRPRHDVEAQIAQIGVSRDTYTGIVTSGDVTRTLIADGPRRIFHIGPDRDLALYDGLDVELVEEPEAAGVVCTGLFDDDIETPEHYADMLRRLRMRGLPFVCANPDIVVERGDRLIWCAGALARDYAQLGGRTLIAGKPHRPIYEAALELAGRALGRTVEAGRVLAIGDGVLTDVKGAADHGIDVLYVSSGVHAHDYGDASGPDPQRLAAFLERHGYAPVAVMPRLR